MKFKTKLKLLFLSIMEVLSKFKLSNSYRFNLKILIIAIIVYYLDFSDLDENLLMFIGVIFFGFDGIISSIDNLTQVYQTDREKKDNLLVEVFISKNKQKNKEEGDDRKNPPNHHSIYGD